MAEFVKAPEAQLELHRWLTSEQGVRWSREWIALETRKEPIKGHMYGMLHEATKQSLLTADPIWVSGEMCEIVSMARESFQPESIEMSDFIVPTGFVYFEQPQVIADRHGLDMPIGAFHWTPTAFQDKHNPEKDPEETRWGMALAMYSSMRVPHGDQDQALIASLKTLGDPALVPLHYTVVEFGEELGEGQLYDEDGSYTAADQWWKLIQSTLRLMQQRVATQESMRTPRPTRRRMERGGFTDPADVLVIRLRRATVKHGEETGEPRRHFSHRFPRAGHWRNQWYPSLGKHRQIYIDPTIVGDESLPLVIKKRYWKWDR